MGHREQTDGSEAQTLRRAEERKPVTAEARRRFGDFVLVARLSEDALGTVYRAIHVGDGRFVRLRLLESSELSPKAVIAAVQRRDAPHRVRSFHPPGRRETLGVAEGRPYLAWHETNGWTLDAVLTAARRASMPLPVEAALRIVAGMAAALEHARSTVMDGGPARHGLVWPGFVTVSRNAQVWVRGFGLAGAVLPSLAKPRIARLIAPYVAPEARERGLIDDRADVYSLGVVLVELLTGRRPSREGPPEFSPADPFSQDVALLARSAVADASQRWPSVVPMRERLEKLIADCPYEGSNADLALSLDDLMAPDRAVRLPRTTAQASRPADIVSIPVSQPGVTRSVWALRIAAAIAAVATLAAVDLAVHPRRGPFAPSPTASPSRARSSIATASTLIPSSGVPLAETLPPPAPPRDWGKDPALSRARRSAHRQASQLAQLWRLRAALSRVAAQQIDAWNLASEPFRAGRVFEHDGERLLASRKFAVAQEAFERAARLYLEAEELSHAERARVIHVSALEERPASVSRPF